MNGMLLLVFVQLIAESLPISSSSHVALVHAILCWIGMSTPLLPQSIDYCLHGCAVLVIMVYFRRRLYSSVWSVWRALTVAPQHKRRLFAALGLLLLYQLAAAGVVAAWYFLVMPHIATHVWFDHAITRIVGLCLTSIALFSLRLCNPMRYKPFGFMHIGALVIVQCCALLPGVSRLASSFVVLNWLGISPWRSYEASCIVAVPIMAGACVFKGLPAILLHAHAHAIPLLSLWYVVCVGMIGAWFGTCLMGYVVKTQRVWKFGWYMLMPIAISMILMMWCK